MKEFYHIVIDGPDAIGKTTQINALKEYFESKKFKVLLTRGIGGPKGSEMELLRNFLFNNHLTNKYIEEKIFAAAEEANLQWVNEQQNKNRGKLVVLQDRGLVSHFAYGLSKDMNLSDLDIIYDCCSDQFDCLGSIHLCLYPQDTSVLIKRIKERNKKQDNNVLSKKYETKQFQQKVLNNINKSVRHLNEFQSFYWNYVELIKINKDDTQKDVTALILAKINEYMDCP